jgi:acyl-CoA dehydrogenase
MGIKTELDLDKAIPDLRGINLYRADPDAAALFAHYLPDALLRHLEPIVSHLGELAGDRLDQLAGIADHNPPTLSVQRRTGDGPIRCLRRRNTP